MLEPGSPLIVLTRPAGRNESIAAALANQGLRVMVLPALTLTVRDDQEAPRADAYDLLVFVSRAAVTAYFNQLERPWPEGTRAAAVGQATAQALREVVPDACILAPAASSRQDSEALLALIDQQQQSFDRVLILRGQQGREWLAQAFEGRGATVTRHVLYRRSPRQWTREQYEDVFSGQPGVMLLTSIESLEAIDRGVQHHGLSWPGALRFVVIHVRIAQRLQSILRKSGMQGEPWVKICVPDESAIFQAILAASR
ncbi:uroporphyrinogen-III synthase [Alcaligenaceae bacterium CGII-47]|nr:uroporphyrinogen-III synthase [Alcaligenaceae bacterium CGII-47]